MDIKTLIETGKIDVISDDEMDCATLVNNGQRYKIINVVDGFEVIDVKDDFAWGKSVSVKGAVINAMNNGVRLKNINFNGHWVPVQECIQAVKG